MILYEEKIKEEIEKSQENINVLKEGKNIQKLYLWFTNLIRKVALMASRKNPVKVVDIRIRSNKRNNRQEVRWWDRDCDKVRDDRIDKFKI